MSTRPTAPLDVARTYLRAMENVDFDTGLQYISADCEYTNGPMGTFRGPAGVRAVLEPFFAPIEKNEFVVHREAVSGPIVFIERLDRHLLGGKWIELPVNAVFEVHDGLITVWHEYFDLGTIQAQMTA
jgi:limonene-1,2-epoxide hydrolase